MRATALLVPFFLGLAVSACAATSDPYVARIDNGAMPYQQAHAACWRKGEGTATSAPGANATRTHAYAECIKRDGWDDRWATL